MWIHSIRTRLLSLVLGAVIIVFALTAGIGVYYLTQMIDKDTESEMSLLIEQKARELNLHFNGIERATESVEEYILKYVDEQRLASDKGYEQIFLNNVSIRLSDAALVAGNVTAAYFRLNPLIYGSKAGIFLAPDGSGGYMSAEPTDIFLYAPDDREHVGWYYEPIAAGHAIWMEPYSNRNIYVYMVSYVTPLYIDGELLGVVGMDVNMADIHSIMDEVHYDNGFGFLISEGGNIIYHKEYPEGLKASLFNDELTAAREYLDPQTAENETLHKYRWHNKTHYLITDGLANGMLFAVSVPESDMTGIRTAMILRMLLVLIAIALVAAFVVRQTMTQVVRPIQELTEVSSRIARGELNIPVEYHSKDEIGKLSDSIRMMANELREYISYIHEQAYTDAMTGVRNKASYMDEINLLDRKIQEELAEFTVLLFDVNGLKRMNDTHGHEYGDMLIIDTAKLLKRVFGEQKVYRIGGDEFIVIEEGISEEETGRYFAEFDAALKEFNEENETYEEILAISYGAAAFRPGEDEEYKDVFKKADEAMYQNKGEYYRTHDRRKR